MLLVSSGGVVLLVSSGGVVLLRSSWECGVAKEQLGVWCS